MKNLVQLLCMIFVLTFVSCSTYVERFPAQVDNEIFNTVFSVPLSADKADYDHAKDFKSQFEYLTKAMELEMVPSKSLGKDVAFKIELDVDPVKKKYIYRVYHAPSAFKNEKSYQILKDWMNILTEESKFNTLYSNFEAYFNARSGDPIAIEAFLKMRKSIDHAEPQIDSALKEIAKEVKILKAKRNKDKDKRKIILDALDKAPEGKQFRAFVAKNDRKNAAATLKKYLPWEEMAPFEKQFWEEYLEIMVNPVPLEQRIVIYRGLADDFIHRGLVKGVELSEKEAIVQNNAFLMSTILTKNQGSWNRRLRSLEAMNNKFIATVDKSDEYAQAARISTIFVNHSGTPEGSPFLSFTPNYATADGFGGNRMSYFAFDPRLLNFNFASSFEHEHEYLVPLVTFPEELVAIVDTEIQQDLYDTMKAQKFFDEQLVKKVAREYGEAKAKDIVIKIKKNSYQFFKGEYKDGKDVAGVSPAASNLKFYKKFLTQDAPKAPMSPKGDMACKDMIALFWMAN